MNFTSLLVIVLIEDGKTAGNLLHLCKCTFLGLPFEHKFVSNHSKHYPVDQNDFRQDKKGQGICSVL